MKRLNLNDTWVLCLKMWKWIAREKNTGNRSAVNALKRQWVEKHGFKDIESTCFFCDYYFKRRKPDRVDCYLCPGIKVDKNFNCISDEYHYRACPTAFYKKLLQLNKIRKEKK